MGGPQAIFNAVATKGSLALSVWLQWYNAAKMVVLEELVEYVDTHSASVLCNGFISGAVSQVLVLLQHVIPPQIRATVIWQQQLWIAFTSIQVDIFSYFQTCLHIRPESRSQRYFWLNRLSQIKHHRLASGSALWVFCSDINSISVCMGNRVTSM